MIIAIDPGHPTREGDRGATAPGLVEHEYTWALARSLVAYMRHCLPSAETVLLRSAIDEVVSLAERGHRSAEAGADLVLALHVDSEATGHMRRASGYYWPGNETGALVAETVVRSMPSPLTRSHGGIYAAKDNRVDKWLLNPRAVIEVHKATAALVECGFASNHRDLMALLDNATQIGINLALMSGIVRFTQLVEGGNV